MQVPGFQNLNNIKLMQKNMDCKILSFRDVFEDITSSVTKIKKDNYLVTGKYRIIDQGKEFIAGYSNSSEGISKNSPHIVFGDHTRNFKYVDFPILLGADGTKLLANKCNDVSMKYVYHFLKTLNLPNDGYSRHFKYLKQIIIPLPILEDQIKIANILDQAQELIDKRKAQIGALDKLIQSVFYEMFSEEIQDNLTYLSDYIEDVKNGLSRRRKSNLNEGQIVLRLRDVKNNYIDYKDINRICLDEKEKLNYLVNNGDLLFVRVNGNPNYVGRCSVFNGYGEDVFFNDHLMRVRLNDKVNPVYIAYVLNTKFIKTQLKSLIITSAGQYTINQKGLERIRLFVPDIKKQDDFVSIFGEIEKQKELLNESLVELENNFNSLMQRAFKGELI